VHRWSAVLGVSLTQNSRKLSAKGFIRLNETLNASEAFPRAAKANSALFFDKKEAARAKAKALSVAEVQGRVGAMIDKRVSRYASVRTDLAPAQVASE
jgi:hypothetical protein